MDVVLIVLIVILFLISIISLSFTIYQYVDTSSKETVDHFSEVYTNSLLSTGDNISVESDMVLQAGMMLNGTLTFTDDSNVATGSILTAINDDGLAEWAVSNSITNEDTSSIVNGALVVFSGSSGTLIQQPTADNPPRINDVNGQIQGIIGSSPAFTFVNTDGSKGLYLDDNTILGLMAENINYPILEKSLTNKFYEQVYVSGSLDSDETGPHAINFFTLNPVLDDVLSAELLKITTNNAVGGIVFINIDISGEKIQIPTNGDAPTITPYYANYQFMGQIRYNLANDVWRFIQVTQAVHIQHTVTMVAATGTTTGLQIRTVGTPFPATTVNDTYKFSMSGVVSIGYIEREVGYEFSVSVDDVASIIV